MLKIEELEDKTAIKISKGKVNCRYVNLSDPLILYFKNNRTNKLNKVTINNSTKENYYNILIEYSDETENLEKTIHINPINIILLYHSVITLNISKNILYIICADEIEIFE